MPSIATALRALGADGARTNAQAELDRRIREEWLVAGLLRRIEEQEREAGLGRGVGRSVSVRGA